MSILDKGRFLLYSEYGIIDTKIWIATSENWRIKAVKYFLLGKIPDFSVYLCEALEEDIFAQLRIRRILRIK